ncbi:MAG: prephenate dehydratase [Candidatus Merdousia sp.]|nr:prephenate dehydratase [Candidatus Merdousia sp.]
MDKDAIRKEIDAIDTQILDLLSHRIEYAKEIGKMKAANGEEIYVPSRETLVFKNLSDKNGGRIDEAALRSIYREIISASISAEKRLMVAYLGPKATFTHQAAVKNFGSSVDYRPMPSIPDVFASVESGDADYGVIPIENSTEGAVFHSMDMLRDSSLYIVGQVYMPIEHCLISRGTLETIRKVCSKDQAIGQCREWLRRNLHSVEIEYVESTTAAVELARDNPETAAVASSIAADFYGVPVLEHGIQDRKNNQTRFLIVGEKFCPKTDGVKYKTSLVLSLNDRPGALYDMLLPFNRMNINLTRIESRPSKTKAWNYYFFLDFEGHWEDENVRTAVAELQKTLPMVKWLGSYPM